MLQPVIVISCGLGESDALMVVGLSPEQITFKLQAPATQSGVSNPLAPRHHVHTTTLAATPSPSPNPTPHPTPPLARRPFASWSTGRSSRSSGMHVTLTLA